MRERYYGKGKTSRAGRTLGMALAAHSPSLFRLLAIKRANNHQNRISGPLTCVEQQTHERTYPHTYTVVHRTHPQNKAQNVTPPALKFGPV